MYFFLHYVLSHLDRLFLFVEEKVNNSGRITVLTIQKKKQKQKYLARPVPLPAGHDINTWDVRALDRCLLRFYLDLSWIIGVT